MDLNLRDKVVIVTGASQGLGRGTAMAFAREKAKVVLVDRNASGLEESLVMIEQLGGKGLPVEVDVTSEESTQYMAKAAYENFGRIDALVNFAGIPYQSGFMDSCLEQWHKQFNVHLDGSILCVKAVVPYMKQAHAGQIVLVGSIGAHTAAQSPYGLAKASVIALTRGLAKELVTDHIRVNCISPGFIRTPMLDIGYPTEEEKATLAQSVPLGRIGTVEEVADLVSYLCSDRSGFITGVNIDINGGQYIES